MLFDGPKREAKQQRGWRLRESLIDYLKGRAEKLHRGAETELVEDAISLHKLLHERLGREGARLNRFAADEQLDMATQSNEAIVRLVLAGLEAHDRKKK